MKVKYRAYDGQIRNMMLWAALGFNDTTDASESLSRLLILLLEKGVISLEEAAKVVKDDSILGWAEDDNAEG